MDIGIRNSYHYIMLNVAHKFLVLTYLPSIKMPFEIKMKSNS